MEATTSQATLVDHGAGDGTVTERARGRGGFYPSRLTSIFPGVPPRARYYGWTVMGIPNAVHVLV
jgi:hypothetical protein